MRGGKKNYLSVTKTNLNSPSAAAILMQEDLETEEMEGERIKTRSKILHGSGLAGAPT